MHTEDLKINIGPQHPSTHGVLRLVLTLNGEIIKDSEPVIGYLHRGKEKMAESRTYFQYLPLVDRVDYLSGFFNSASFCMAVEKLADLKVPEKAEWVRIITMELNRVASHLLWLGTFLLDLGATSPLFYAFREREDILKLFEDFCGARMMFNAYCFGGVKKDFPEGWTKRVLELCGKMPAMFDEYETIISKNPIILERTKGVGILKPDVALEYGITGPNLRASGVDYDVRKADSYSNYDELDFKTCVAQNGDCYDRYVVRIEEMHESLKIVKQAIEKYEACQSSELVAKKINPIAFKPAKGESTSYIESSRGLTTCYVISDGTPKPQRVKWRAPSFSTVQVLPEIIKNRPYSDLTAILGSLDPILPEVDR